MKALIVTLTGALCAGCAAFGKVPEPIVVPVHRATCPEIKRPDFIDLRAAQNEAEYLAALEVLAAEQAAHIEVLETAVRRCGAG